MLRTPWGGSYTDRQNSLSFIHSSYLLQDDSTGWIAREFWWTSQEFSPAGIIVTMALHAHISPGRWTTGPLVAAVLRQSSLINIINQSSYPQSSRPLTTEAWVSVRVSPCGICGGQSGTGQFFSESFCFPLSILLHCCSPYRTIGLFVVAAQRHSLAPSTWRTAAACLQTRPTFCFLALVHLTSTGVK
jgi:hypothetical protein